MRLWKVKTWADLTIETTTLFGRKKRHHCYFTYKTKYIYAETKDEALDKYYEMYFAPMEDGYDKDTLPLMQYVYDTKSYNMVWELPFNQKIVHTHEHIYAVDSPVKENIKTVIENSSADDFKDWFFDVSYYDNEEPDVDGWLFK